MYSVSVIFKNSPQNIGFTFRTLESAQGLYDDLTAAVRAVPGVKDDFGLQATIHPEEIAGVTLLNMGSEFDRQGEIALLQAKSQVKAQNLMRSDASLTLGRSIAANGN